MSKKLIPFSLMPASWGMKGKTREKAQAEYELEGEELERKLAFIDLTGQQLLLRNIEIDFKYKKIDEEQFLTSTINIEYADKELERNLKLLSVERKYKGLSDNAYEKRKATILKEPWVIIMNTDLDKTNPKVGSIELDWNEQFIEMLEKAGYLGKSPEETVNQWFSELCKQIAMEQFDGVGDFNEKADAKTAMTEIAILENGKKEFK